MITIRDMDLVPLKLYWHKKEPPTTVAVRGHPKNRFHLSDSSGYGALNYYFLTCTCFTNRQLLKNNHTLRRGLSSGFKFVVQHT